MNTSSAVMQQRAEPADSLDFFPTPPWGTRVLCEQLIDIKPTDTIWEPACGEGAMAKTLMEYSNGVTASDIFDYGYGHIGDFLSPTHPGITADWIITNPPFKLAKEFIQKSLGISDKGVAMILRIAFLEGITRYNELFSSTPPTKVGVFSERIPMVKGRLDKTAGSATCYAWFVWEYSKQGTELVWIPPCRKLLERDEDYEAYPTEVR